MLFRSQPIVHKPGHRTPPGILRCTYTPPDPAMAYAVQQSLGSSGTVLRAVRSVGKAGPLYYYAADLRFLVHDGIRRAWPKIDTDAWPQLRLEITQQPHGWRADLMATSQALGDIPAQTESLADWQTVNPDKDQDAAVIELQERASKWANRHGLQIDGLELIEQEGGAA